MAQTVKRQRINLTIREDIIQEARDLGLNTSQAAEAGLVDAIRKAKEEAWLRDNADAIKAHNERIETEGVLITPPWLKD